MTNLDLIHERDDGDARPLPIVPRITEKQAAEEVRNPGLVDGLTQAGLPEAELLAVLARLKGSVDAMTASQVGGEEVEQVRQLLARALTMLEPGQQDGVGP